MSRSGNAHDRAIRRHIVIKRGGLRFGLFGLMGKESMLYTNASAITYPDAIETAKDMVALLRDKEKVDIVICLSHGGLEVASAKQRAHPSVPLGENLECVLRRERHDCLA